MADLLKAHPGYRVRVEGNTDNLGSARSNERLGLARANAVKDFLVKYGAANCVTTAVVGGTTTCQTVVRLLDLDLSGSSSPAGNNPLTFFTTSRSTGQSYSIQHRRRRPFSSLNCSATTSLT